MKIITPYRVLLVTFCMIGSLVAVDPTTLNYNDPLPLFSTQYPYSYLGLKEREYVKTQGKGEHPSHFGIRITPFYQRATGGKSACGHGVSGCERVALGDIRGTWNMLALLNDSQNTNTNPCRVSLLTPPPLHEIGQDLVLSMSANHSTTTKPFVNNMMDVLSIQQTTTYLAQTFGCYSAKGRYYKRGIRFDINSVLVGGFGFSIKTGLSQISFCPTFVDLTPTATRNTPLSGTSAATVWASDIKSVQNIVMSQLKSITSKIGLDICQYRSNIELEDLYGEIFWRHPFEVNKYQSQDNWRGFLFIPIFVFGGSLPIAKAVDTDKAFALSVGNNGHASWYIRSGVALDFYETIEIAADIGFTGFDAKKVKNMFLPNTNTTKTNVYQSGIFPCQASACVKPGRNLDFGIGFNAYRFMVGNNRPLDYLSFYFQYRYINHEEDKINLVADSACCDTNVFTEPQAELFAPELLACKTGFTVQVFNIGFNYDISPNMVIGFGAQIPYKRKGAFRSTTLLCDLELTF